MKVPRSGKCGILPCVAVFEEFAGRAEGIVMGTERRAELDKAYQQLIDALFKTVERAAVGHPKTPPDVIKFGELQYRSLLLSLTAPLLQRTTTKL